MVKQELCPKLMNFTQSHTANMLNQIYLVVSLKGDLRD